MATPFPDNPQRAGMMAPRRAGKLAITLNWASQYTTTVTFVDRLVPRQLMPSPGPLRSRAQVRAPLGIAAADNAAMIRAQRGG